MSASRFDDAMADIAGAFHHPSAIVEADYLNWEQKAKLLHEWEYGLRQLLVASEEGMSGCGPGSASELLSAVRTALESLGIDDDGRPGAAGASVTRPARTQRSR